MTIRDQVISSDSDSDDVVVNKESVKGQANLTEAAANGSITLVDSLLTEGKVDINQPGPDGTTPLCAASLWGNIAMVEHLIKCGANVNATNAGTLWTSLHAAAFQEAGKIIRTLLENGANPTIEDHQGRTPADYASISEAVWSFFSVRGCERSCKQDLIEKGIIHKLVDTEAEESQGSPRVDFVSRPGSAYFRADSNPYAAAKATPRDSARGEGGGGSSSRRMPLSARADAKEAYYSSGSSSSNHPAGSSAAGRTRFTPRDSPRDGPTSARYGNGGDAKADAKYGPPGGGGGGGEGGGPGQGGGGWRRNGVGGGGALHRARNRLICLRRTVRGGKMSGGVAGGGAGLR